MVSGPFGPGIRPEFAEGADRRRQELRSGARSSFFLGEEM